MDGKYKIPIKCDRTEFAKLISELVDSGMFVYSYMRCKSWAEIINTFGSSRDGNIRDLVDYSDWMVIRYHDECKRIITGVTYDWKRLEEFEEISLEDFLKKEKEENAIR